VRDFRRVSGVRPPAARPTECHSRDLQAPARPSFHGGRGRPASRRASWPHSQNPSQDRRPCRSRTKPDSSPEDARPTAWTGERPERAGRRRKAPDEPAANPTPSTAKPDIHA
ncbi:hypothetical protein, partial [Plasmodium yoelii yoelii]